MQSIQYKNKHNIANNSLTPITCNLALLWHTISFIIIYCVFFSKCKSICSWWKPESKELFFPGCVSVWRSTKARVLNEWTFLHNPFKAEIMLLVHVLYDMFPSTKHSTIAQHSVNSQLFLIMRICGLLFLLSA